MIKRLPLSHRIGRAIDRGISLFAPGSARRRLVDRVAHLQLERHLEARLGYEGADRGHRTRGWKATASSANAFLGSDLPLLRARCRDLVANEGWARSAVRGMTAATMGTGFKPRFDAGDEQRRQAWRDWAESSECDFDRRYDLAALQVRAERVRRESGEALIVRRFRKNRRVNGRTVPPICLQVLEGDFLDTGKNEDLAEGRIVQGVEESATGEIVAYWLFDKHPGDQTSGMAKSSRIPADDVLHYFHEARAGQRRGVPLLTPVILRLRDWGEYADAELLKQKLAAAFAIFVYDSHVEPVSVDSAAGVVDQDQNQDIEPGTLTHLPPGKRVESPDPPQVNGFGEFTTGTLLNIAKAVGAPYELLTGDFSRSNFSSARMAWLSLWAEIDQEHAEFVRPLLLDRLWGWFEVAARTLAGLPGFDANKSAPDWRAPKRTMNDVVREQRVRIDMVKAGLTTLEDEWLSDGLDPIDMYQRLEDQQDRLDEHGLVLTTDARKFSPPGSSPLEAGQFDAADENATDDAPQDDDPPPARGGAK